MMPWEDGADEYLEGDLGMDYLDDDYYDDQNPPPSSPGRAA